MRIIDAHAHIFPEKIAQKAVMSIGSFYYESIARLYDGGKDMSHGGTTEELLKSGREIGISKYLVFSTATRPEQVESINRFIGSECEKHSELIGLGTMHIGFENFENEINYLKEHNMRGIKLHPDFQKFSIDDERLYPIFDCLSSEDMFVLTHSGDYRYKFSNPSKVARVAKLFPKLKIIAAHFGGWSEWDEAREYLNLPNVYFDTSSTLGFNEKEKAIKALDRFDKSHFFFGTDFPMWDHKKELERFLELDLPSKLTEDILYNNFADFYGFE